MKKYITVCIKKLFNGMADVRDYMLAKAMNDNKGVIFDYYGKKMTIEHKDLDKGIESKEAFSSQWGKPYKLISFDWIEDKVVEQPSIF